MFISPTVPFYSLYTLRKRVVSHTYILGLGSGKLFEIPKGPVIVSGRVGVYGNPCVSLL
jgi:hypothetical protein